MSLTLYRAERVPGQQTVDRNAAQAAIRAERVYSILVPFGTSSLNYALVTGLPAIGAQHPDHAALRAQQYEEVERNGRVWHVRVIYEPIPAPPAGEDTKEVVQRSFRSLEIQRELIFDAVTGALIVNTAGDPFDSALQVPAVQGQIVITQKENAAPTTVMPYTGSVNSASITIAGFVIGEKKGRIVIDCEENDPAERFAYTYTYTITLRENLVYSAAAPGYVDTGWREGIVSQGYRFLDTGELLTAMTKDEETGDLRPATVPVHLDENGERTTTPHVLLFDAHTPLAWSGLDL